MFKSTYLANLNLDAVYGSGSPASITLALFTALPTIAGGGTKVSTSDWTNYADKSITNNGTNFPAASSGLKQNGAQLDFATDGAPAQIPGAAVNVVGWGTYSGANLLHFGPFCDAPLLFTGATSDVLTAPGHTLVNGNPVFVTAAAGAALPTGLAAGTYYVRDVSGDTFKLAATAGGAAVDVTGSGVGFIARLNAKTVNNGDAFYIPANGLQITET